ncbi:hypothetical protein XA67_23000 [Comamonas thiooxydans]|nr:hypothetical protein XA67_23000 [Comamonas thiooxydans]
MKAKGGKEFCLQNDPALRSARAEASTKGSAAAGYSSSAQSWNSAAERYTEHEHQENEAVASA